MHGARLDVRAHGRNSEDAAADRRGWGADQEGPRLGWPLAAVLIVAASAGLWLGIWTIGAGLLR